MCLKAIQQWTNLIYQGSHGRKEIDSRSKALVKIKRTSGWHDVNEILFVEYWPSNGNLSMWRNAPMVNGHQIIARICIVSPHLFWAIYQSRRKLPMASKNTKTDMLAMSSMVTHCTWSFVHRINSKLPCFIKCCHDFWCFGQFQMSNVRNALQDSRSCQFWILFNLAISFQDSRLSMGAKVLQRWISLPKKNGRLLDAWSSVRIWEDDHPLWGQKKNRVKC